MHGLHTVYILAIRLLFSAALPSFWLIFMLATVYIRWCVGNNEGCRLMWLMNAVVNEEFS